MNNTEYTTQRIFTQQQVEELFLSVGWVSGNYPCKLYSALLQSSYVLTAWDRNRLVALLRGIDDGCMTAFLHYLIVAPDHHHQGIASQLVEMAREHYKDFLYINLMPEERKNAAFYECHGFKVMPDGVAMQMRNADFTE